jgi:hypothetical protein
VTVKIGFYYVTNSKKIYLLAHLQLLTKKIKFIIKISLHHISRSVVQIPNALAGFFWPLSC